MYTQCPDCQTRFRVTADALRAAHGTVRCGRCGGAFDALVRLSDALPRAEPEVAPLPLMLATEVDFAPLPESNAEPTVVLVDESEAGEDITLEGERVSIEGLPDLAPAANEEEVYDLDATDHYEALHIPSSAYPDEQEAERELEALVQRLQREFGPLIAEPTAMADRDDGTVEMPALTGLEGYEPVASEPAREIVAVEEIAFPETIAPETEPEAEREIEPALALDPERELEVEIEAEPEPETPLTPPPAILPLPAQPPVIVPVEERPLAARRWQPEPVEFEQEVAPARSVWRTLAWTAGSLLLALVLAAQVVHHYRQDLARDTRLGPPLRAAYARVGVDLPPNSDLGAFELRQWGDDAREAGRLVVRASLTNRAEFAQPHPVLRLQFEDRFGSLVATRDFDPADYLKDPSQADLPMVPGARSEVELLLADPGAEAVGYRLDVCLRESAAVLRCGQG
jgi:predicted Zn finger-like uncharacterized protein